MMSKISAIRTCSICRAMSPMGRMDLKLTRSTLQANSKTPSSNSLRLCTGPPASLS